MQRLSFKLFSFILLSIMVLSIGQLSAFAASVVDSGTCGENLSWTLDSNGGLTISGIGEMTSSPWKAKYSTIIRTVVINTGVTSIEKEAFKGCKSLNKITIADSVTDIGSDAFDNTSWYNTVGDGLVYIGKVAYRYKGTMPKDTIISIKEGTKGIAGSAFYFCQNLIRITIPESITRIGDLAFYFCSSLTNIWVPTGIMSFGDGAFQYCEALTSFTIPNTITSIPARLFYGCQSLINVTIPNSVTNIGYAAFHNCCSMNHITIPNSITTISGNAFDSCTKLENIIIPEEVTSIGENAFRGCKSLTSIFIPENVESIGDLAFEDCTSLKSITFSASVTELGNSLFSGCYDLESIIVDSNNPKYHSANNCIIDTAKKTLFAGCKTSIIPSDGSVTKIGNHAFMGCSSLTGIEIPETVTSIGISAFFNCSSIGTITIPTSISTIGNSTFYGCTALTSISIPDNVSGIGENAFSKCTSLKDVYYYGSEDQWNRLLIEDGNVDLVKANIHFNWTPSLIINSDTTKEQGDTVYISPNQTVSALVILAGEGTRVLRKDGSELQGNETIGSGMTLIKHDGSTKTLIIKGDNDGDGIITAADARYALRVAVALEQPNSWQENACLVTDGATVTAADARLILRAAVGLESLKLF